jgi:hypothetical protein
LGEFFAASAKALEMIAAACKDGIGDKSQLSVIEARVDVTGSQSSSTRL